ncbi:dienelactone hydrolase family protein, partial [Acinetobacter baumannii]|uniref:aspartate-alanine antiporter-like transporter n=1 Tax=Acinetobacter baumannii TaxID=470 RepID=UPI0022798168
MPPSANLALRELGIVLFLAVVGLKSGGDFVATLTQGDGLSWIAYGIFITAIPLLTVGVLARMLAKMNYLTLCGMLAGSMTDPDIRPEYIHYPSPDGHGEVRAYLVTPTKIADKAPAVVVVHENRGLNPYIEDVARRVAKAGYIALAPDGLSAVGGYPGN